MTRWMIAAAVLCLTLSGAPGSFPQEENASLEVAFCPECWMYVPGAYAFQRATCHLCGKPTVEARAGVARWLWCPHHSSWHRRPCPEATYLPPLKEQVSIAWKVDLQSGPYSKEWYCPQCKAFRDSLESPRDQCHLCQKPLVRTEFVESTWFWCTLKLHWGAARCSRDPFDHCCQIRTGILLAQVSRLAEEPLARAAE
jgi:hypothetical protein